MKRTRTRGKTFCLGFIRSDEFFQDFKKNLKKLLVTKSQIMKGQKIKTCMYLNQKCMKDAYSSTQILKSHI